MHLQYYSMPKEQAKQFMEDYALNHLNIELGFNDDNWGMANERLNHPEKYYYKER